MIIGDKISKQYELIDLNAKEIEKYQAPTRKGEGILED